MALGQLQGGRAMRFSAPAMVALLLVTSRFRLGSLAGTLVGRSLSKLAALLAPWVEP